MYQGGHLTNGVTICPTDDHVHELERFIHTVKERVRCTMNYLPFKRMPRIMTRSVVVTSIKDLNQLPAKDGIFNTMNTLNMMTGRSPPDYNKNCSSLVHMYRRLKITTQKIPQNCVLLPP